MPVQCKERCEWLEAHHTEEGESFCGRLAGEEALVSAMTQPSREMWEERYGSEDFVFGTEPNDFLRENVGELPTGEDLLEVVFVEECVRAVIEGPGHTGDGAVVQFIARKGN